MLPVPTLAVGEPDLLLINVVPLPDILVELRGDVDAWESEEPQGENGRCRGSGATIEAEYELVGEPGFDVIIDGADVGAVDIVDSADDDEDEAARRGDRDFVPIRNIILNRGAPEDED